MRAFLALFLRRIQWSSLQTGTSQPLITQTLVRALELPVPPLAEQRRIVAKVEALLAQVDAARERLEKVPLLLKRFRESVLAAACSGQLTADWRSWSEPTPLDPQALLSHRRQVPTKSGRHRHYELEVGLRPEKLEIAESWTWSSFDQVTSLVTKGSSPRWQGFEYVDHGITFVRSQNVRWGALDLGDKVFVEPRFNVEHSSSVIKEGDVLLNLVGASVGRAAVATHEIDGANCNQAVGIIRTFPAWCDPCWAVVYLQSPFAQEHIGATKVDVARANFNLDDIKRMAIPLPPLDEQREIVRVVQALLTTADEVERKAATAKAHANKIAQAILQQAFFGDVVPHEAELARSGGRDFESAENLLRRMKNNRIEPQPQRSVKGMAAYDG
jgi:type I restriction enzyme S subunit